MPIVELSLMKIGAFTISTKPFCKRRRSSPSRNPSRNFVCETRDWAQTIRCSSDSFDISSEKIATARGLAGFIATYWAMLSASAVFPIAGRAARMMSSPGRKPPVISSSFKNPVEVPRIRLVGSRKALIPPSARPRISRVCSSLLATCDSPSASKSLSALAKISSALSWPLIARSISAWLLSTRRRRNECSRTIPA